MKRRGLLFQTAHTVGSMVGNQGLQIIAGVVIARVYGPAGKGVVTYAGIAILAVIAIADGLSSAIIRQCGNDRSKESAAYWSAFKMIKTVSIVAVTLLVAIGLIIPSQRALLFVGIAFPFAIYTQTMNAFHLIARHIERTNAASLVINGAAALLMLLAVLCLRPSLDFIMSIWSAGYIAGAVITHHRLPTMKALKTDLVATFRVQARFAIRTSAAALMTFLASRIDVFVVAALLPAAALGNYTLALACGELMWQIGRAISWSAYSRVASEIYTNAADLTAKMTRIVIAVEVIVAIVTFVVGPTLFATIYGPSFAQSGPVLRILIPGMALYAADAILTYFISVRAGLPRKLFWIEASTLLVCATGSLATIGRLGMIGPATVTTIAFLVSFSVKLKTFRTATGIDLASLLVIRPSDIRLFQANADQNDPITA